MAQLSGDNKFIAREYLTMGDYVGKGHFGCVYKARLYIPSRDESEEVAVKTLQTSGRFFPKTVVSTTNSFFLNFSRKSK